MEILQFRKDRIYRLIISILVLTGKTASDIDIIKLRKDISCQINEDKVYSNAVIFLGEEFVRITETGKDAAINTYYDWEKIVSVRTIGKLPVE